MFGKYEKIWKSPVEEQNNKCYIARHFFFDMSPCKFARTQTEIAPNTHTHTNPENCYGLDWKRG